MPNSSYCRRRGLIPKLSGSYRSIYRIGISHINNVEICNQRQISKALIEIKTGNVTHHKQAVYRKGILGRRVDMVLVDTKMMQIHCTYTIATKPWYQSVRMDGIESITVDGEMNKKNDPFTIHGNHEEQRLLQFYTVTKSTGEN